MMKAHGDREARRLELAGIASGFEQSIALLTAVKLGIFSALSGGAKTTGELCEELKLAEREAGLLLQAVGGLDLLARDGEERWSLHGLADEFLRDGAEFYMGDILAHNHSMMQRWARMDEVVASGETLPRKGGGRSQQELRDFILGMQNISKQSARELADGLDLRGVERILDVGGGPGTYLYELLRRRPDASGAVLDLPEVIEIAAEQREAEGMEDRAELMEGDMFETDLGGPYDLILLSNIIHSHPLERIRELLGRCAAALAGGGRLVVKDFLLDESGMRPAKAALFSLNMMIGNPGRSYRREEIETVMRELNAEPAQYFGVGSHSAVLVGVKR
jgi:SAM-dependent methyltransferase